MPDELALLDAVGQADLVRRSMVQPLELVDAAIERIECLNPVLNAVITRLFDNARATALGQLPDGPFRGVPLLLKDYYGEPTSFAEKPPARMSPRRSLRRFDSKTPRLRAWLAICRSAATSASRATGAG
jgi:Asp-tRNA(Asn)/Glu-tRNA(Gln) amidotransferase A subunit family amidase